MAWLKSVFFMSDADVEAKCGTDALHYLRFQRHVMVFLAFVVVVSIAVILPLNFQGNLLGDVNSFEHTTLSNLEADSKYLWAHISFSFLFFVLAIVVMRRFSATIGFQEAGMEIGHTLMIENVPKTSCHQMARAGGDLLRHFQEAYPRATVCDVQFAYEVQKLMQIHEDLKEAKSAKKYCADHLESSSSAVYDTPCSRYCCCFCCCCCKSMDVNVFYDSEVIRLTDEFERARDEALKRPLGIAFVTFATVQSAKDVFDSLRKNIFQIYFEPPTSSVSAQLKPKNWLVTFASTPDDIYWQNLGSNRHYFTKKIVSNVLLFLIALFLTTPAEVVSQLNIVLQFFETSFHIPPTVAGFLPTILTWSFTALMPLLVAYSDRWLGHRLRSGENYAIMYKSFVYLLLMVLFLPTFGFTTGTALLQWFFNYNGTSADTGYRWECIFLPDSGAYFVNYIITSALFGCALELVRVPDLLYYLMQTCWSRSEAEIVAVRRRNKYEFRFGEQYSRMMLMLSMTVMFSMSCPLITPFGIFYFFMKHWVDRHNILYVNERSTISKKVHSAAIYFVILSTIFLQFFMTLFSLLRNGATIAEGGFLSRSTFAGMLFLVSVNIFNSQVCSATCRKCSPVEYVENTYIRDDGAEHGSLQKYLPDVLVRKARTKSVMSFMSPNNAAGRVDQSGRDVAASPTNHNAIRLDQSERGEAAALTNGSPTSAHASPAAQSPVDASPSPPPAREYGTFGSDS